MDETNYRTIEGLKLHPLWNQLSTKQQVFLLAYIESNGDKVQSAHLAWDVATDGNAEFMASRALKYPLIRKLLAAYYGYDESDAPVSRKELVALISQRLRSGTLSDRGFENLTEMLLDLMAWSSPRAKSQRALDSNGKRRRAKYGTNAVPTGIEDKVDVDELVRQLEQQE